MLLFPDMTREQHEAEEFCYAAPCTFDEWKQLRADVQLPHDNYLPFVSKEDDNREEIYLILRSDSDSDNECVATAAYIRFAMQHTGMIYAIGYTLAQPSNSIASIIGRTSGVPYHQVRHIEV